MRNQLVYDLPLRFFHWLFAALFSAAFLIAKTVDDESPTFSYHMLAGILLGFILLLRIAWGFLGTKHSRFASFALQPKALIQYFAGLFSGDRRRWVGHNPASSWAALTLFGLAFGLGLTGILMANGQKESFEDLHELLANAFLVVVILHIAGVILHSLRHRDGLALSMIDGAKGDIQPEESIAKSRWSIGFLFLGLTLAFASYLGKNYDSQQSSLNLFGFTLQLGEHDEGHNHDPGKNGEGNGDDETDDDD